MYANDRGSSPLTRGKQGYPHTPSTLKGLIPAPAGKTSALVSVDIGVGAHPRSRGENFSAPASAVLIAGSSPLTRGKPKRRPRKTGRFGLIPAHAGKTKALEVSLRRCGAHPRSRGENRLVRRVGGVDEGSSPLTRGKPRGVRVPYHRARLIPAHAGKTRRSRCPSRRCRAHPRSRGENNADAWFAVSAGGSSPLTRGKRAGRNVPESCEGLIPAHAGKTRNARLGGPLQGAHPRSRGENPRRGPIETRVRGSSPLTRGKRGITRHLTMWIGLIPAHAGKTLRLRACPAPTRAHPRSRGENLFHFRTS